MQEKVIQGFRLSPQQRHLWSLQKDDGGPAYRALCEVEIEGALDPEILKDAVRDVVDRQEILRTTFQRFAGMMIPVQVISEEGVSPFRHEKLCGLTPEEQKATVAMRFQEARQSPLDLERGPLVFTSLFTLTPSRHVLHISLPTLCADTLGLYNLVKEIARSYAACLTGEQLIDESVQYADLSEWQNELLESEDTETGREFWRKKDFSDVSALKLPSEFSSPIAAGFAPQCLRLPPDTELITRVQELCRKFETSPPTFFAACWQVLLWRLTRQPDFTLGIALDGRKHEELKEAVGLLAKFLPHQSHLEQNQTYAELLAQVGEAMREMNTWQEFFSQQQIASAVSSDSGAFFFPYCFQFDPPSANYSAADISFSIISYHACVDRFKIKLSYAQSGGSPSMDFHYDSNLFSHQDIIHLAHQYHILLASVVEHPEGTLGEFEILSKAERQQILIDFNRTQSPFPQEQCLHQLIENQVERMPDAVAVVFDGEQLSYRELNRRANQLAHYLQQRGVGPEVGVAVCMERSLEMVVALLGIMKAGGAYVPLHPAYPKDSLAFQLQDCRALVLLTLSELMGLMPESAAQVICLDTEAEAIALQSDEQPLSGADPGNMVLLQYTSGSMGKPKGIVLEHRSLVNYLSWVNEALFDETMQNVPSVSRLTVDASLKQLFAPLLRGGRVWIIPSDVVLQPAALLRELSTIPNVGLNCVPSLWSAVLETIEAGEPNAAALKNLTGLLIGGEELTEEITQRSLAALPQLQIWNLYGPAEATANITAGRITSSESITIGRGIANTQVYILDSRLQPLPLGSPGELFVGGLPLARGYFHRPDLTAASFLPNPFSSSLGSRLYRTGDLARFLPGGQLEFLGRADQQLKVRGFRIEPGEVESALLRHPQVRHAVVTAREDTPGLKRLVAYLVCQPREPGSPPNPATAEWRSFLAPLLPEQMVPSAFVLLAALPLLPNGKLDRRSLPAPDLASLSARTTHRAARTPEEAMLCAIWREVLGVSEVGVDDNFFELGGDSILSIQIIARANRAGLRLTPRQLFEHQTVAGLAAVADTSRVVVAEQGAVEGGVRLTPIQARFFSWVEVAPHHFNQTVMLEARAALDLVALERVVAALVGHHDALRLRFMRDEAGAWVAHNAAVEESRVVSLIDLSAVGGQAGSKASNEVGSGAGGDVETRRRLLEAAAAQAQQSLFLSDGPLLRIVLFDGGNGLGVRLLLVIHHLVIDGVSWRILLDDLQRGYEQATTGDPIDFDAKGTSWREWAERQHAYVTTAVAETRYWEAEVSGERALLPRDFEDGDNLMKDAEVVTRWLDETQTRALLTEVPAAYRTQINDVLLAALAETLGGWCGGERVVVELEGHGREELGEGVDVTRTVGWFTSRFPVALETIAGAGSGERLRRVKEKLRKVPKKGVGFGVLKYLGGGEVGERLRGAEEGEVSFNYLGQFDGVLKEGGLLKGALESGGASRDGRQARVQVLEVSGGVAGGRLQMNWRYGKEIHERATVERVAEEYMASLGRMVEQGRAGEGVEYGVGDFELAEMSEAEVRAVAGSRRDIEDIYPLSPMQQGMLYHCLSVESSSYFGQTSFAIRGELDVKAFAGAWQRVMDRHSMLRTAFDWEHLKNPVQIVSTKVALPLQRYDWRELPPSEEEERIKAFLKADRELDFDLSRAPLMRLSLIQVSDDTYNFIWSHHHIQLDGWSVPLLLKEIFLSYEDFRNGEEPQREAGLSYRDYIAWLRRQDMSEAESFWRKTLKGFGVPTPFGIDRARVVHLRQKGAHGDARLQLSEASTETLQSLARQNHLTLNTIVQGMWALLLSHYSGEKDVVFGITVSGRPAELVGVESIIGPFFNTLPIRVGVNPESPVLSWLSELQTSHVELHQFEYSSLVQQHSDVPLGQPLFENILVFENYPVDSSLREQKSNVEVLSVRASLQSKYALTLIARPTPVLSFRIAYDQNRFDATAIDRMLEHLRSLLEDLAANPARRVSELQFLSEAERRHLLGTWDGDDTTRADDECVHTNFETQVESTPDALAVVNGQEHFSYRELNGKANQVAHHLRALGIGPETCVGLYADDESEMIIGMLGIFKAGGAYLALDTRATVEHLAFIIMDAECSVVLTQRRLASQLDFCQTAVMALDTEAVACESRENLSGGTTADGLAAVIYGKSPISDLKGTMVTHRGVCNSLKLKQSLSPISEADRVPTGLAGGIEEHGLGLFWPLTTGATLVVANPEAGSRVVDQGERKVELDVWLDTHAGVELHSFYKLPEAGGEVSRLFSDEEDEHRSACIAGATANTLMCLLNVKLELVPVGVVGELYVSGVSLVRGYINQPALTAERFIPNLFSSEPGARLFKTEKLGRRRDDGSIEIIGRVDQRVRVGGASIDLGEVAAVLAQHPSVRESYVTLRDAGYGEQRLIAYLGLQQGAVAVSSSEMRGFMRGRVSEQMIPDLFEFLEELPKRRDGRLDVEALLAPQESGGESDLEATGSHTPVAEMLAGIWAEILGARKVGGEDNFFEMGGHSLLATQLVSRIRETFEVEISLRSLFQSPTVTGLAEIIDEMMKSEHGLLAPPMVLVSRDAELPLSFGQQRLWFLDQMEPGNTFYNGMTAVRLSGKLHVTALEQTLNEIVRRHEVLRTSFPTADGKPLQVISPAAHLSLQGVDLSESPDAEQAARRMANGEVRRPFDISRGPLLRVTLLRLSAEEHVVLFAVHHIVFDAWSRAVLVREVAALYAAFHEGQPSPLPELEVQYADYAHWQRNWLQGEVLEEHLSFWRRQLGGTLPTLLLPVDRTRPAVPTYQGARHVFTLSKEVSNGLKALSRREGTTIFMTLLAAYNVLLYRFNRQEDILVGTSIAGRTHSETEALIGFFINMLVLRANLSGDPTFRELLAHVREQTLNAYAHQGLPFDKIVEELQPERQLSKSPIVQAVFGMQNVPGKPLELPELKLSPVEFENETARFDLTLLMSEEADGLRGIWRYATDLFDAETIAKMTGRFETLLRAVVETPESRIDSLEFLTESERDHLTLQENIHAESSYQKLRSVKPKTISAAKK